MTEAELAWLAGLLEGEGSFVVSTSRYKQRKYLYARIMVSMADRDVIERVRAIARAKGGVFTAKPTALGRLPLHRVWVNGQAAADLMRKLRPWMGERRKAQIDRALEMRGSLSPTAAQKLEHIRSIRGLRWVNSTLEQRQQAMRRVSSFRRSALG